MTKSVPPSGAVVALTIITWLVDLVGGTSASRTGFTTSP